MRTHGLVSERGQSLVELALLLVLIALVALGILRLLGVSVADVFCQVVTGIGLQTGLCPGGSGPLFSDDFSGDLSNWEFLRGNNWSQENEQLCVGRGGEHRALALDSDATDYTVAVDALLTRGNGYGVYFRASTDDLGRLQGYIFQYDPGYGSGQFLYRQWVNGYERSPFARGAPPAGFEWLGTERHIEVVVQGNTFTARVDGETVLVAQDDAWTSGQAGLRTWDGTDVCFDNFTVTAP